MLIFGSKFRGCSGWGCACSPVTLEGGAAGDWAWPLFKSLSLVADKGRFFVALAFSGLDSGETTSVGFEIACASALVLGVTLGGALDGGVLSTTFIAGAIFSLESLGTGNFRTAIGFDFLAGGRLGCASGADELGTWSTRATLATEGASLAGLLFVSLAFVTLAFACFFFGGCCDSS